MRATFAQATFGLVAILLTIGCGPGVLRDPTLAGTGGQVQGTPPPVQEITPIDLAPYDPQPGKTFRPCGTLGEGQSYSSAYSLDGTLFAMGFTSGVVKIYRTSDLAVVATFAKAFTAISAIQFSPDGTLIASASMDDSAIEVWRVSDGTTVSRMPSVGSQGELKFSANAQYLGVTRTEILGYPTYAASNIVSIRSVADGSETCKVSDGRLLNFSADGSTAWVATNDTVTAYAVQTCLGASDTPSVTVGGGTPFAMSPDGQMVFKYYDAATGETPTNVGATVVVAGVRATDGQTVWTTQAAGWPSIYMFLSAKGDFVVLWNLDPLNHGNVTLLNANNGTMVAHLGFGPLRSLAAVSPDGSIVVTNDSSNDAVFWRASDGFEIGQLPRSALAVGVDAVTFTADSAQLLVASAGQVRFWNVQDRTAGKTAAFPLDGSTEKGIALSQDSRWVVAWNGTGVTFRSLAAGDDRWDTWWGTGALFSADGRYVYAFSDTNVTPAVRMTLDTIDRESFPPSAGFQAGTDHLVVSSEGQVAALTGSDGYTVTITQFDGTLVRTINLAPGDYIPNLLAFSPDGQYLAGGFTFYPTQKSIVRVWKVADGTAVSSFAALDVFLGLAFSPDGSLIATFEDVWNWREGTMVETFLNTAESNPVVSPDGRTIATTSGASTVTLWCRP